MKTILLAGACALALTSAAFAQSGTTTNSNSSGASNMQQGKTTGMDATKDTSNADKRTIPGNNAAGGSNPSSPNTTQPGASKAGGG